MFLHEWQTMLGKYQPITSSSRLGGAMSEPTSLKEKDDIIITPEMISAGADAYYENTSEDWASPGGEEMRRMIRSIFSAMWSQRCLRS